MADTFAEVLGKLVAYEVTNCRKPVDLAAIVAALGATLGEFIVASPRHEQANLLAYATEHISKAFLQISLAEESDGGGRVN